MTKISDLLNNYHHNAKYLSESIMKNSLHIEGRFRDWGTYLKEAVETEPNERQALNKVGQNLQTWLSNGNSLLPEELQINELVKKLTKEIVRYGEVYESIISLFLSYSSLKEHYYTAKTSDILGWMTIGMEQMKVLKGNYERCRAIFNLN